MSIILIWDGGSHIVCVCCPNRNAEKKYFFLQFCVRCYDLICKLRNKNRIEQVPFMNASATLFAIQPMFKFQWDENGCNDVSFRDEWRLATNINYALRLFVWCFSAEKWMCVCALSPFMIKCVRNVTQTQITRKANIHHFQSNFSLVCMHQNSELIIRMHCATTVAHCIWMSAFLLWMCATYWTTTDYPFDSCPVQRQQRLLSLLFFSVNVCVWHRFERAF